MTRDELVTDCLRYATPMIQRLACDWREDFEELYQEAALVVLNMWHDGKFQEAKPLAYAKRAIRWELMEKYVDRPSVRKFRTSIHPQISLDEPLTDFDGTLAELVPESGPVVEDELRQDQWAQVLYKALWKLSLEEQAYLREIYQLNAFSPRWMDRSRKPDYSRKRQNIGRAAFYWLRRDKELASALEVTR